MSVIKQNISSTSLFHFMKKREYLFELIENFSFQCRFVHEDFYLLYLQLGIPMKCFCDIPLGQIKYHISKYGNYGIGVTKDFARSHGISPIHYIHHTSELLLRVTFEKFENLSDYTIENSLIPYLKLEQDYELNNKKEKINIKNFYEEREWRYYPPMNGVKIIKEDNECDKLSLKKKISDANNSLIKEQFRLKFDFKDISYIFVNTEKDIATISKLLRKKINLTSTQIDILISKFITKHQIINDF